jgi:hypothetical protein
MAPLEKWRRFLGQQLMLLTELMLSCVAGYFVNPCDTIPSNILRRGNAWGAKRSNVTLRQKNFVKVRTQADTVATRSMAVQYAKLARVCDVQYDNEDTGLFVSESGLKLPEPHDEKNYTILLNTDLTPTDGLQASCTDFIMQVQTAAKLGRLPSISSTLLCITWSELNRFNKCYSDAAISDVITESLAPFKEALEAPNVRDSVPPTLVRFLRASSCDVFHTLYGVHRLARCIFKHCEKLVPGTKNSFNCRFKYVLNGFRARRYPVTELYLLLHAQHNKYQVHIHL